MNFDRRQTLVLEGPACELEVVINEPIAAPRAIALVAHPHPLFGGTLDNKVTQTLANAYVAVDAVCFRMNFRGVGKSGGVHDNGIGEAEDMLWLLSQARERYGDLPLYLAGFSFGAYVQTLLLERVTGLRRLVLVAPAVGRFTFGDVPPDTVVIHGEKDTTVPLAGVMDWAREQDLPVIVIPSADHFFHKRLPRIRSLVVDACRV